MGFGLNSKCFLKTYITGFAINKKMKIGTIFCTSESYLNVGGFIIDSLNSGHLTRSATFYFLHNMFLVHYGKKCNSLKTYFAKLSSIISNNSNRGRSGCVDGASSGGNHHHTSVSPRNKGETIGVNEFSRTL